MCAIVGVMDLMGQEHPVEPATLAAMLAPVGHRGPDGMGTFHAQGAGLGHARLSIIDPETGQQPISNEDGSIHVVVNGEIFNYLELRKALQQAGHVFKTDSDTEVVVHLYEECGPDLVEHLNGQFAIAVWDSRKQRLVLIRDRVGIAPLYYTQDSGWLYFGSEIKALLPVRSRAPQPNLRALDQLMTFWSPVSPETMVDGVYELPPGHYLIAEKGELAITRYWDWDFSIDERRSEDELIGELEWLLTDAVRLRLRSDVPVGAYLSGGLDSSAIAATIQRQVSRPISTFSIGFDDAAYDESDYQRLMAAHLGTRHHAFACSSGAIRSVFPATVWHAESPMLRTAPAPMQLLAREARNHGYKVILTGEGADEVLGGYDIFKEAKIRQFWGRAPESEIRPALLKRLYPYLNLGGAQSHAYLKQFFGKGLDQPASRWFSHIPRWSTTSAIKSLYSPAMQALSYDPMEQAIQLLPDEFEKWHWFGKAQYLEAKLLLPGYLLSSQGDRMLMASGVEGRYPFLDHRLIEFGNRLRPSLKMRGLNEKYLLKKAMGHCLPRVITQRTKQPYRAPEAGPFRGTPGDYLSELLDSRVIQRYGYFAPSAVQRLQRKMAQNGRLSYRDCMAITGIVSTQLWHHMFIERAEMPTNQSFLHGSGESYVN